MLQVTVHVYNSRSRRGYLRMLNGTSGRGGADASNGRHSGTHDHRRVWTLPDASYRIRDKNER